MKRNKRNWIYTKNASTIAALVLAVIAWIIVAMTDTTTIPETVKNVPVNLSVQESAFSELGLSIISTDVTQVSAQIRGDRVAVGSVKPEDLTATVQLGSINYSEGNYELNLVPAVNSSNLLDFGNRGYEITGYSPSKITVKLDRIETESFPIRAEVEGGIKVAEGYILEKNPVVTPKEVIVSGPRLELDKIQRAMVRVEPPETLEKTYAKEIDVILLDTEGNQIDPEEHNLTVDNPKVQVAIPVLKQVDLPLKVEFSNIPRGFPKDDLTYTMSNYDISVAGPEEVISRYNELLLGFVDVSEISLDKNVFTFEVELPDSFVNLDNILTVTVEFVDDEWEEATFNLTNIEILNIPVDYQVTTITSNVAGVKMVGDADALQGLTAEDIIVELDLAEKRDIKAGQYKHPVKISAPYKGLVWASGEYSVVIQVRESD